MTSSCLLHVAVGQKQDNYKVNLGDQAMVLGLQVLTHPHVTHIHVMFCVSPTQKAQLESLAEKPQHLGHNAMDELLSDAEKRKGPNVNTTTRT